MKKVLGTTVIRVGLAALVNLAAYNAVVTVNAATNIIPPIFAEQPPQVHKYSNGKIEIEPHAYSGDYLTMFPDGRIKVMIVTSDPYITYYGDTNGIVDRIDFLGRPLERSTDYQKDPLAFAHAQTEFTRVFNKYRPYLNEN